MCQNEHPSRVKQTHRRNTLASIVQTQSEEDRKRGTQMVA